MNKTIITLSNGLKVANFSSPHSFGFEDGSILPARDSNVAEMLKVTFIEEDMGSILVPINTGEGKATVHDIALSFKLSGAVNEEITFWFREFKAGNVHIVIIPLPMLQAMYAEGYTTLDIRLTPFRTIRMVDRIKKLISIDKFCV